MSVFKLPKRLCNDINGMFSKFWWGKQQSEGGIQWRKWDKMGMHKGRGGLGFRDLESFNLALLAKQGWRLTRNSESLAAVVFKKKYFRHTSFMEAKLGSQPSLIWRSVWLARGLLQEGLRWKVGDGSKIKIWGDKWLSTPTSYAVQSPVSGLQGEARVEELIVKHKREWDEVKIRSIFSDEEAEQILSIPLSRGQVQDKIIWGPSKKGVFTVNSAYYLQLERIRNIKGGSSEEEKEDKRWRSIWELEVPRVVKS
ncbi:uncharacterized mitochondrial protein AtMg00310-like [Carya illinoinensis]|uniref:uncharacterized mitochondrial protein AtMg00310-like n=1 Tax=Carya illinoinensis TaxID=32201 RepID=UPI001C71E832|nr:uncharacterized mitochondrial protein AtMg00310-like [Carya illinoinensis]